MSEAKSERSRRGASGLFFIGFLIPGFAVGLFTGNIAGGFFAGLGIGFIDMAISRAVSGKWW